MALKTLTELPSESNYVWTVYTVISFLGNKLWLPINNDLLRSALTINILFNCCFQLLFIKLTYYYSWFEIHIKIEFDLLLYWYLV